MIPPRYSPTEWQWRRITATTRNGLSEEADNLMRMTLDSGSNVAEELVGRELLNGWLVTEKVSRRPGDTGGNFSVNYLVTRGAEVAFCKVINFGWIMMAGPGLDPTAALRDATDAYLFERDIARDCRDLSKVVTAIDDGSLRIPGFQHDLVSYIIFEKAEHDVRRMLDETQYVDIAIKLRLLHNLAVGLRQLHSHGVAHQDVKPSNLLIYADPVAGESQAKVADLGRATTLGREGPFDELDFPGDWTYAPPEILYGQVSPDFLQRRVATDMYQLGGMISFCLTTLHINAHLTTELHPIHHWSQWKGTYGEVLPYVRDAMGRARRTVLESAPESIRLGLSSLLEQLCEPDPCLRGDSRARGVESRYSLSRFVTKLDLLARSAQVRRHL